MSEKNPGSCPHLGDFNPDPKKGIWICGYHGKTQEYCMIKEPTLWETKCPYYIAQLDAPKRTKKKTAADAKDAKLESASKMAENLVKNAKRTVLGGVKSWIQTHVGEGILSGTTRFYFLTAEDYLDLMKLLSTDNGGDEDDTE